MTMGPQELKLKCEFFQVSKLAQCPSLYLLLLLFLFPMGEEALPIFLFSFFVLCILFLHSNGEFNIGVKVGGGGSVFIQSQHIYKVRFFTQKDYTRFKSMAPPPQLPPSMHTTPLIEEVTEEVKPPSSPQLPTATTSTPSPPQPTTKEEDLATSSKEKKVPPPRPPLPQNYVPSKAKEPEKTG